MVARKLGLGLLVVVIAFAIGATGAPGKAAAVAAGWLADRGHVTLVGPVGEAVREAL
ncbi:MAG: hypothetical protein R3F59_17010 [Myxococcota bacterium]